MDEAYLNRPLPVHVPPPEHVLDVFQRPDLEHRLVLPQLVLLDGQLVAFLVQERGCEHNLVVQDTQLPRPDRQGVD